LSSAASLAQANTLAADLPRLIIAAERLAFVAAPGLHGRRRGGPGDSFWQFRDWQSGDDVRKIDWRRSAQGDRLYFREREWQAQASITLALDDTSTLQFNSEKSLPTKRERTLLLLLALASILLRAGERVALAGITPPVAGPHALQQIAAALVIGGKASLDPQARRISFGDFLGKNLQFPPPGGGAVMHILDPAECDFPYQGRIIFDGFTDAPPLEATKAETWASAYRARITAQREAVAKAARDAGATPLFHRTDHPPAPALTALYQALLLR
jgi:uncharacterized protein (DUF58 family)